MIKFGVAGNSRSFFEEGHSATLEAASWCKARGIDVFEYSFGRGVTLPETTAKAIGDKFREEGVCMSIHAPYFINFANLDPEMIKKSIAHVTASCKKAKDFGCDRVVVHPASQGKLKREEAMAVILNNIALLKSELIEKQFGDIKICFETMGKQGQMGTVDEIIKICSLADNFYPCIDFGHVNAREGGILKCAEDYNTLIQKLEDFLPKDKVFGMHIHFSKIEYGAKGEIRHLTFADEKFGPDYRPLMEVLHTRGLEPYVICESDGTQAEDTVTMKNYYFSL